MAWLDSWRPQYDLTSRMALFADLKCSAGLAQREDVLNVRPELPRIHQPSDLLKLRSVSAGKQIFYSFSPGSGGNGNVNVLQ